MEVLVGSFYRDLAEEGRWLDGRGARHSGRNGEHGIRQCCRLGKDEREGDEVPHRLERTQEGRIRGRERTE